MSTFYAFWRPNSNSTFFTGQIFPDYTDIFLLFSGFLNSSAGKESSSPGEGIDYPLVFLGFPGGSEVKNLPAMQETWVQSLGWEDPQEEGMATTPVFLPGESPVDRGAWQATVHGVEKSKTGLSN